MTFYLIGIDGGGTSCRAAVAALGGRILGRGKAGAANILTDPETALQNITDAARDAFGMRASTRPESGHRARSSASPATMWAMPFIT